MSDTVVAYVGPSISGGSVSTTTAAKVGAIPTGSVEDGTTQLRWTSVVSAIRQGLVAGDTIHLKGNLVGSGSGKARYRWLIAIRIGD